jgi:hypothetical protein
VHFVGCHLIENQQQPLHNLIGRMTHRDNDAIVGLTGGKIRLSQCLKIGPIVGQECTVQLRGWCS